ncbi:MAG: F0F1 ATP synthase subunit alpha [Psittacicella sp.]
MLMQSTEIIDIIKQRIENLESIREYEDIGVILSVKDSIITIAGLDNVMQGEIVKVQDGTLALALNLNEDSLDAVVMSSSLELREGMEVYRTHDILQTIVGENLLGRVVDPLGNPIDGKGDITSSLTAPIEVIAPGVMDRKSVGTPLQTGYKLVDAMIPIGRGQRELIIGDRQSGKTALAVDTIINQKGTGVKCIYVSIGQKDSSLAAITSKLEKSGALEYTTIVSAGAASPAIMQYLAPYAGCAMGEYYRDLGQDALIVYDDLTKQANAYRQISLLLRRSPGREAFPGDIFYVHSRLLERACQVNEDYIKRVTKGKIVGKTGSLTALPIVETQGGDVSSFIPTNVISITDGQIFLETNLFNKGMRPAVNPGISVSRVGGAAQTKVIKKLSGGMRIGLAQFRELEAFLQFSQDLDQATRLQLLRGQKITEFLKQKQYNPYSIGKQALVLFAIEHNYIDHVELDAIRSFETNLFDFANQKYSQTMDILNASGDYNNQTSEVLKSILDEFIAIGSW